MENREIKAIDLAKLSGVSKGSISLYLSGKNEPGQFNTYKIAQVLKISPAWLMGLSDDQLDGMLKDVPKGNIAGMVFEQLNDDGKKKVMEYVSDIAGLDQYKKGRGDRTKSLA